MERKFDFHVTICEEKDSVRVTADAQHPSANGLLASAVCIASWVATAVAAVSKTPERELMHYIANTIIGLADEKQDEEEQEGEENGSVEQRV